MNTWFKPYIIWTKLIPLAFIISCNKGEPGYGNSNSASIEQSTISSDSNVVNNPIQELPSGTFVFSVSASNNNDYLISVTDSSGSIFGNDPTLRVKELDNLTFYVDSPGHPFYLKTTNGTGSDNQISNVTSNGTDSGTVSWSILSGSEGTYYYQCSVHENMYGEIIVEK